jgi:hypothetical protein
MKLSFTAILSESFGFFFARLGLFFHLVTIPWILSLALRIVASALVDQSLLTMLVEKAIEVIPTIMFLVGWMRLVLLGPARVERLPGLGWSPRETAFLIHLLKVAGITFALFLAFVLTLGSIDPSTLGSPSVDPELTRREAMAAPLGAGFMVSVLLALRVSFGLAATAVDLPWSPRRSWAYGRGNSWVIIGAMFVVFFAGAIATSIAVIVPLVIMRSLGANTGAVIVTWTIAILVSYGGVALTATTQAVIWRRLTGWREGVPLA